MINKGFLNSKSTADASKLRGNLNVDVEGLAASGSSDVDYSTRNIRVDEKIRDMERKIVEGKLVFADDDGVPLPLNDEYPIISTAANDGNELGSQSIRDANMEQLTNQVKPVSLGNVVNDMDANLPKGDGVHVSHRVGKMSVFPMNDTINLVPSPKSQSQNG